jgi:hypothetical protein
MQHILAIAIVVRLFPLAIERSDRSIEAKKIQAQSDSK